MRLRLILLLAALHGLIYVFAVPPWQHYDEPAHFDYAYRLATEAGLPLPGSSNGPLHLEMVRSMLAHGFYRNGAPIPDLTQPDANVGVSQLGTAPLFYWWVGLPIRIAQALGITDVTPLLYLARLASLCIFVLTVAASQIAPRALFPPQHPMQWLVPLAMALLPSMADLMTAVNDDVIAILFGTLFLALSARLIQNGLSLDQVLLLLSVVIAGALTRRAILPMLGSFPLVLLLAWVRRWRWAHRAVWLLCGIALVAAVAAALRPNGAQSWVSDDGTVPCAEAGCPAQLGQRALQIFLQSDPANTAHPIWQLISMTQRTQLSQATITLGAWLWADPTTPGNANAQFAVAGPGGYAASTGIALTSQPTFHAVTLTLPTNLDSAFIQLYIVQVPSTQPMRVFADGFTLVKGERPLDQTPSYDDATLHNGHWGGQPFVNLLRNPSFETPAWQVSAQIDRRTRWILRDTTLGHIVFAAQDAEARTYYQVTAEHWLQTFWGRFGWGHVPFANLWMYSALLIASAIAIITACIFALRHVNRVPWAVVLGWGTGVSLLGFAAFTRGVSSLFVGLWLPGWRYIAPANLTVIMLLAFGGYALARWVARPFKLAWLWRFSAPIATVLLLGLDAYALYSQWAFYQP